MNRTVRLALMPTPEQAAVLAETTKQFTAAFNAVCEEGWRLQEGNAYTLHHLTYYNCRARLPQLPANLLIQARQKAAEAVKSTQILAAKGKRVSGPQSSCCSPRYNPRTFSINWESGTANLSTVQGQQKIAVSIPEYARYAIGHATATADLVQKKKRWYLHVCVKLPDVAVIDNGQALGVDLGVTRPAVTSHTRFLGKKHWREVIKRRLRLKRKLQSNGSKSAKRHLRRLAGRDLRFRRDCDHVLSKRILEDIEPGTVIVVENLTNIRKRVKARRGEAKRRLHSWSFAQLKAFLEYKAEAKGCRVKAIDPRHTSQRCSRCGHTHRGNRRTQSDFRCRECSHSLNADLNAARNIRDKHLVGWGSAPSGALPSTSVSSQLELAATQLAFG